MANQSTRSWSEPGLLPDTRTQNYQKALYIDNSLCGSCVDVSLATAQPCLVVWTRETGFLPSMTLEEVRELSGAGHGIFRDFQDDSEARSNP